MRPRDLLRGPRGLIGGGHWPGGRLGDPMGPSGWFDESSDDLLGICACI